MNKINILVLDDTGSQRREVITRLIPCNLVGRSKEKYHIATQYFNIIEYSRPSQAEQFLRNENEILPDLIISDIRFEFPEYLEDHGEERGIDFIKFVHTNYPNIPTIAITFYGIDRVLGRLRRELPNLTLDNIYTVAREDDGLNIADIDNVAYGLPFLLKKIAERKLLQAKFSKKEKKEVLLYLEKGNFEKCLIETQAQSFEFQYLMLGWANIVQSENATLKLDFEHSAIDILREYLDDNSFDYIGRMNTTLAKRILRDYFVHTNHSQWVAEIRAEVQNMLEPFFIEEWKTLQNYEQIRAFLKLNKVNELIAKMDIRDGNYLDLNEVEIVENEAFPGIKKIKNLLKARLIVLTIMHRRLQYFKAIPNVADLAILLLIHSGHLHLDFLMALQYNLVDEFPREDWERFEKVRSNIKSYYKSLLCIRGNSITSSKKGSTIQFDNFFSDKLLQEERDWLDYIDEKEIFF